MNELAKIQDSAEETAITSLKALSCTEPEQSHSAADEILLTFIKQAGFEELAERYELLRAHSPWWGCG